MLMALGIGTFLGILSGLGLGGGSLLMLWLTAVCSMEQTAAQGVNLLFFLPAAGLSCIRNRNQIHWATLWQAAGAGLAAAALGAFLARFLETELLRKLFGGLLILTGLQEMFTAGKPGRIPGSGKRPRHR